MPPRTAPAATAAPVEAERVQLPIRSAALNDLLLWRNPIKSGVALLAVTALYAFFKYSKFNLLVVFLYALISLTLGCFLWNSYADFSHKSPVPVPGFITAGVSEEQAKQVAERYTVVANRVLGFLKRVVVNHDIAATSQVVGALYTAARIAALVSPLTLAYILIVLAFVLPKAYEMRKPQVDAAVAKARAQATRIYDQYLRQYMSRVPRASNAEPIEILNEEIKKVE